jgi:hypothetical protein
MINICLTRRDDIHSLSENGLEVVLLSDIEVPVICGGLKRHHRVSTWITAVFKQDENDKIIGL